MALLKSGTRVFGTLNVNTAIFVGNTTSSLNVVLHIDRAFAQANVALTQANAAFIRANNALNANVGGTISGNLVISGSNLVVSNGATELFNVRSHSTTGLVSTSNSTGTITITGGVGIKGNVYADQVYDNGLRVLIQANAAFAQANISLIQANAAFAQSNIALTQANAAFITANGAFAQSNIALTQANAAFITANGAFAFTQVASPYDFDDVSYLTDGITTIFPLQYNQANVTVAGAFEIFLEINGKTQPSFANTYEVTWQSSVLPINKGFRLNSDGQVQVVIPPPPASDVLIRFINGTENTTVKRYPFKPLDVLMGY